MKNKYNIGDTGYFFNPIIPRLCNQPIEIISIPDPDDPDWPYYGCIFPCIDNTFPYIDDNRLTSIGMSVRENEIFPAKIFEFG